MPVPAAGAKLTSGDTRAGAAPHDPWRASSMRGTCRECERMIAPTLMRKMPVPVGITRLPGVRAPGTTQTPPRRAGSWPSGSIAPTGTSPARPMAAWSTPRLNPPLATGAPFFSQAEPGHYLSDALGPEGHGSLWPCMSRHHPPARHPRGCRVLHGSTATGPDGGGLWGTLRDGDLRGWTRVDALPRGGSFPVLRSADLLRPAEMSAPPGVTFCRADYGPALPTGTSAADSCRTCRRLALSCGYGAAGCDDRRQSRSCHPEVRHRSDVDSVLK
jgi:hypothetical protein